jgi:cobalt-zinc-cadmium resistance protein CzcA
MAFLFMLKMLPEVTIGREIRQGAVIKNGYTESVAAKKWHMQMIRGGNAREVVNRIKQKVTEINGGKTTT